MKNIKNKGLAVGLAATLTLSPFLSSTSFAAEKGLKERVYPQMEQFQKNTFEKSELTKQEKKQFSDNQLVIKYSSPISARDHLKAGGKLVKRVATLGYDIIEVKGNQKLETVANGYAKLTNVTSISRSAYGKTLATDPKASQMYHLNNLNLSKAQSLAGKNKVKVGVIDTGLDANHPELKNRLSANINMMDPMKKGSPDTHGTHVAGIIAGEKDNGIGGYGVAPNAEIVSIDVSNRSFFITDYIVAEGILEAIRQKVKVINMSLGFYYPSPILEDAVKKAVEAGVVVVAAAGNDGASVLNYPASFDGVISVGATDSKNQLAFFSTFGPSVDVVAPGHDVYAPVLDVDKGSSFVKMSGTSMASPVVAGAAALLLSKYPNLTPYQVNYMMTETARDLGEKGYDLKYGFGMIDPVKLLSYDPKKIPADPTIKSELIQQKAKFQGEFELKTITGKIQKLNQTDFYSTVLKKGESVQATLVGSENYDLKMDLYFYEAGKLTKTFTVNDVSAGTKEGTLFEAPENGVLVFAIRDSFGKYDAKGQYSYNLHLEKNSEFLDEGNTLENPIEVTSLPYKSENQYFKDELLPIEEEHVEGSIGIEEEPVAGEEAVDQGAETEPITDEEAATQEGAESEPVTDGTDANPTDEEAASEEGTDEESDEGEEKEKEEFRGVPGGSDFFRIKVPGTNAEELQAVKVSIPGVAGIDSTIVLYATEKYEGQEMTYQMDRVSDKGYGKGEELIFNGVPGQEYIVEVTNKPYIDEFMIYYGYYEIDYNRSYSSLEPYQLSVESKSLPKDEDGFPYGHQEETVEQALIEGDIKQYIDSKKALQEIIITGPDMFFNDHVEMIKEAALSIEENNTIEGYIQTFGDEDFYTFKPTQSATFEVNIDKDYPVGFAIMKYDKEYEDFMTLYSNEQYSMDGFSANTSFTVGLQAGETYYLRVADLMYRPGFNPYSFSINTKIKDTADAYESNDVYKKATKITTNPIYANFSTVSDTDMYYFKPGKEGIYSVKVTPGQLPKIYQNAPSSLQSEIDPVIVVIEDTNGDGKLDEKEEGSQIFVDYTMYNQEERTGFRTKKNAGYFIVTFDYFGNNSSLVPYVLKVDETNRKDEDQGSVVKNNVPSKPVTLGKNLTAKGYLNLTSNKGDSDYYKLNLSSMKKVKVTLEVPSDIDGKVTIYNSKGSQVAVIDSYAKGDNEVREITLAKGTYFVKVEDYFGNASTDPYTLRIQ